MLYHLYPYDRVYSGRRYVGTLDSLRRQARLLYVSWILIREDGLVMAFTYDTAKYIGALKARYQEVQP